MKSLPCQLVLTLISILVLAATAMADQNGTSCPDEFSNGSDTMTLTIDAICDGSGQPIYNSEPTQPGMPRDGCFWTNEHGGYGLNVTCNPCPSNWQNCTPCNDYANECGSETPDPPPGGGGFNQTPNKLKNFAHTIWNTLDWLTA